MKPPFDAEFPLDQDFLHLNHAAVGPWPVRTIEAINRFAQENLRVGSWHYPQWLETEQGLRQLLADLINADSAEDVALVKNTSEALSFVAAGIDWQDGENIVSSDQEFPSNRIVWESLAPLGVTLRQADLQSMVTPEDALFSLVDDRTRMIAISSVQYASGLQMDLSRIGRFCRERDILFCVDAIQSVGAVRFDVQEIGADFAAADGHKWMLGPEGLGFFYVKPEIRDKLKLTQFGWHMVESIGDFDRKDWQPAATARRFECGSPNMLAIHALHASLSLLHEVGMENIEAQVLANSRYLFQQLSSVPEVELLTPTQAGRYAGIVTFRVRNRDNGEINRQLHEKRLFCAHRGGGIRFSPHFYTQHDILDSALQLLHNVIT